jgi:hypothetical protein
MQVDQRQGVKDGSNTSEHIGQNASLPLNAEPRTSAPKLPPATNSTAAHSRPVCVMYTGHFWVFTMSVIWNDRSGMQCGRPRTARISELLPTRHALYKSHWIFVHQGDLFSQISDCE